MIHLFEDILLLFTVMCLCCRGMQFSPVAVLLIQSRCRMDGPCIPAKATIPTCFLESLLVLWHVD